MAVITISRQYGSGGDEIAELICEKTGYRIFDKYLLAKEALEAGLSDQEIFDYSEDNYKTQSFFDRLLGRQRAVAHMMTWVEVKGGVRVEEELSLSEEQALAFVRKAVNSAAKLGNILIVGRGGQMILKDHANVLHLRIEAPLEERILRVRGYPAVANRALSDSIETRRAAQDLIEKSDAASADYLRRFYGVDWSAASLYHLVLNTGKLSLEQAAGVAMALAQQMDPPVEIA